LLLKVKKHKKQVIVFVLCSLIHNFTGKLYRGRLSQPVLRPLICPDSFEQIRTKNNINAI
ncbi:MAG: hypothetical protein IJV27_12815, partial [Prevotella sp.]|nr:hypothetical protein [Prevotella sp.]